MVYTIVNWNDPNYSDIGIVTDENGVPKLFDLKYRADNEAKEYQNAMVIKLPVPTAMDRMKENEKGYGN